MHTAEMLCSVLLHVFVCTVEGEYDFSDYILGVYWHALKNGCIVLGKKCILLFLYIALWEIAGKYSNGWMRYV